MTISITKAEILRVSWLSRGVASWEQFMHVTETLHDRHIYDQLQTDLIEHIGFLRETNMVNPLIYFMHLKYI
jgi:hypothetical protein